MRIRVLAVGKDRKGIFKEAVSYYVSRIKRYLPFELVEILASKNRDPERARQEEASRILDRHAQNRRLVLMDSAGESFSSENWSLMISRFLREARDVDFVLGGDEGLAEDLNKKAEKILSLGPITLPHQLARVVLLEQLYRAMTILRSEPYHK